MHGKRDRMSPKLAYIANLGRCINIRSSLKYSSTNFYRISYFLTQNYNNSKRNLFENMRESCLFFDAAGENGVTFVYMSRNTPVCGSWPRGMTSLFTLKMSKNQQSFSEINQKYRNIIN